MASAKTGTLAGFGLAGVALGTALTLTLTTLTTKEAVNFTPTGTTTGAVIQVNGTTQFQVLTTACTATGGLAKYPTCIVRSPYTTTGAILSMSMDCGSTNRVFSMSGGFVKSTTAAVASAFPLFVSKSVSTGSLIPMGSTGALTKWNPADLIKVQTVSIGGTPDACAIRVTAYDKLGS